MSISCRKEEGGRQQQQLPTILLRLETNAPICNTGLLLHRTDDTRLVWLLNVKISRNGHIDDYQKIGLRSGISLAVISTDVC